jgi:hypothetical protein
VSSHLHCSRDLWLGVLGLSERIAEFWPLWILCLIAALVGGAIARRWMPQRVRAHARWIVLAAASAPIVWCAVFGLELVCTRWSVGAWPFPRRGSMLTDDFVNSPMDPKDLGLLHFASLLSWPFVALALYWFPVVIGSVWARRRRIPGFELSLFAAGYALFACLWYFDPGQFLEWWFD